MPFRRQAAGAKNDGDDDGRDLLRVEFSELKVGQSIGKGAQAHVLQASLHGQSVAVKRFNCNEIDQAELRHLQEKILLIKKLGHRNVIRLYGICYEPLCIVTELCLKSLDAELYDNRGRLITYSNYINWTRQIANGMAYIHANDIIHRDLKSNNILLAHDGGIKICDFDTSRRKPSGESTYGSFCGTKRWMAPEIMREESYSNKVDIWSFGVVQFEMLTQQMPYANEDKFFVQVMQNRMRPKFPSELHTEVQNLLLQMVNFDPQKRPNFKSIVMAIGEWPDIPEKEWRTMKQKWKLQNFNCAIPSKDRREKTPNVDPPEIASPPRHYVSRFSEDVDVLPFYKEPPAVRRSVMVTPLIPYTTCVDYDYAPFGIRKASPLVRPAEVDHESPTTSQNFNCAIASKDRREKTPNVSPPEIASPPVVLRPTVPRVSEKPPQVEDVGVFRMVTMSPVRHYHLPAPTIPNADYAPMEKPIGKGIRLVPLTEVDHESPTTSQRANEARERRDFFTRKYSENRLLHPKPAYTPIDIRITPPLVRPAEVDHEIPITSYTFL